MSGAVRVTVDLTRVPIDLQVFPYENGCWFLEWAPDADSADSADTLISVTADSREHFLALGEAILDAARMAPAYVVEDR